MGIASSCVEGVGVVLATAQNVPSLKEYALEVKDWVIALPDARLKPIGTMSTLAIADSKRLLKMWFNAHIEHPYPTQREKEALARENAANARRIKETKAATDDDVTDDAAGAGRRDAARARVPRRRRAAVRQHIAHHRREERGAAAGRGTALGDRVRVGPRELLDLAGQLDLDLLARRLS